MEEDKSLPETQIMEDTWENVGKLAGIHNPLFDQTLFLMGYDFSSNIYLLQGEYCSLIDPGNDYTAFMQMLDLGIKPPDIKKIALTHGHHDHAMGAIELVRGYRGYADSLEIELFLHEAGPVELKEMLRHIGYKVTELKGGETINLSGFDLEVIHTPGHTIDGLCFYHAPTRTLFSGDTVLPLAMAEPDEKVAGGRLDHYLYSVRSLLKMDVDHVFPGHGGLAPNIGHWVVEETYDGLIKKQVGIETSFLDGATKLAGDGLLEEALFYIKKALAAEGENPDAQELQALLLNDLGRPQEALEAFDQVLAQNPDHVQMVLGKGCALMGLGRYEDSLALFDEVLVRQPQSSQAQIYKGMALYLAGRVEEAMAVPAFRQDFATRFKDELDKLSQPEKGPKIDS
jgi:glyoxylase-like metal-dependent hydrolase (beta-lactamase superfamily II)